MNTHAYRLSRRTAFGLAGAASATVALAACSGGVNGVSSQSERTDFSGEIKFDSFDTSAGEYKPATKDHPAENVPKPKKPDNANDKSAAGFLLVYWLPFRIPCSTSSSLLTPNP